MVNNGTESNGFENTWHGRVPLILNCNTAGWDNNWAETCY